MKKKTTPQPRNYLVKLALFRKAGSHKKSNKAIRRLEKSKKSCYSGAYTPIAGDQGSYVKSWFNVCSTITILGQ